jgi:hypothetical protein
MAFGGRVPGSRSTRRLEPGDATRMAYACSEVPGEPCWEQDLRRGIQLRKMGGFLLDERLQLSERLHGNLRGIRLGLHLSLLARGDMLVLRDGIRYEQYDDIYHTKASTFPYRTYAHVARNRSPALHRRRTASRMISNLVFCQDTPVRRRTTSNRTNVRRENRM